jgi:salicylate hydroxylase
MPTRVAIIGGGPGGLAAAIALSELPFLSVTLYDQSPQPREIGAGLSLSANAWKVLDLLGASDGVRGSSRPHTYHRNAYNGAIFDSGNPMNANGDKRGAIRARRSTLQAALFARIPAGVVQHNKKLVGIENLAQGVLLRFQDGTEAKADLAVGADGIHSV